MGKIRTTDDRKSEQTDPEKKESEKGKGGGHEIGNETEDRDEGIAGDREQLENILMRFCRQSRRFSVKIVAAHMGVSIDVYRKMEKGDLLITYKQAVQLGDLYEVSASWFFKEAIQLDLLLSRMAIIRILKNKNDLLIDRLKSNEKTPEKRSPR